MAAAILLAGCGSTRRPTTLGSGVLEANGRVLMVEVNSCNGEPAASVVEEEGQVVVTAQANHDNTNTCLDGAVVTLANPLGDRQVVDGVSGRAIKITRRGS